jgi:hypothetical protein
MKRRRKKGVEGARERGFGITGRIDGRGVIRETGKLTGNRALANDDQPVGITRLQDRPTVREMCLDLLVAAPLKPGL